MDTDTFEKCIRLSKELFDDHHFEAAYHALVAAEHYARDMGNAEQLRMLKRVAEEQLAWIDAHATSNVMSTTAAERRPHGVNLYGMLIRQAATQAQIIETKRHRKT